MATDRPEFDDEDANPVLTRCRDGSYLALSPSGFDVQLGALEATPIEAKAEWKRALARFRRYSVVELSDG